MNKARTKSKVKNTHSNWARFGKWAFIILPAFAFLLYSNTLNFGYNGDDDAVTRGNKYVQLGLKGTSNIFTTGYYDGFVYKDLSSKDQLYRPLSLFLFAVEKEIWGNNPKVGHWLNVIFYSLASLLLLFFLTTIISSNNWTIPISMTILFIAHPVHTEVVANIKSSDDILCLIFLLIALITLVKYMILERWVFLAVSIASFACALLSKESAITFLALAPLTVYFTQKSFNKKKWTCAMSGVITVSAIYLIARLLILGEITNPKLDMMDNSLMAAQSVSQMLATNFVILWKYIQLLFIPITLSWDYSYNQIPVVNWSSPMALLSLLIQAGLLIYALLNIKNKNWIAYGILFYFITLSISSNLVIKIASTMAERFLFIPSFGFCIAIILCAEKLLQRIPKPAIRSVLAVVLITGSSSAFSYKTIIQNKIWKDPITLMESGVNTSPNSARAHLFLGHEYMTRAISIKDQLKKVMEMRKAIDCYRRSLLIYPEYGGALNSIGSAFHSLGAIDSAIYFFSKVQPSDKEYIKACFNLGDAWFSKGQNDSALNYFLKVLPGDDVYGLACNSIGFIYAQRNQPYEAITYLKKVSVDNPVYGKAMNNTGKIYLNLIEPDSALKYFNLVPENNEAFGNASNNVGNIYMGRNDLKTAISYFKKVKLKHGIDYRDALFFTGKAYSAEYDAQAIGYFQQTIAMDPNFKPAYEALGRLYSSMGDAQKAAYYVEKAQNM